MSKQAISAFLRKVAEDETLQKDLVDFAEAHGFEFTVDELSDVDLENVAGGLDFIRMDGIQGQTSVGHSDNSIQPLADSSTLGVSTPTSDGGTRDTSG